jgi:hypothetical protein
MTTELLRDTTTGVTPSLGDDPDRARRQEAVAWLLALPKPPGPEPEWADVKREMLDSFGAVEP